MGWLGIFRDIVWFYKNVVKGYGILFIIIIDVILVFVDLVGIVVEVCGLFLLRNVVMLKFMDVLNLWFFDVVEFFFWGMEWLFMCVDECVRIKWVEVVVDIFLYGSCDEVWE